MGLKVILQRNQPQAVADLEVRHAGLFELVPQSARDDVHGDVVGDHPADAGQSRLDTTEARRASVRGSLEGPTRGQGRAAPQHLLTHVLHNKLNAEASLLHHYSAVSRLTSSAATVRQGQCFLVSFTFMDLAFWMVFRALDKLSGATSRQISLSSDETPSIWYSSKKFAWREAGWAGETPSCPGETPSCPG